MRIGTLPPVESTTFVTRAYPAVHAAGPTRDGLLQRQTCKRSHRPGTKALAPV